MSAPSYPIFICPNCRAAADLEADVEEPEEEWEQLDSDEGNAQQEGALLKVGGGSGTSTTDNLPPPRKSRESVRSARQALLAATQQQEPGDVTVMLDPPLQVDKAPDRGGSSSRPLISHTTSNPMPIPIASGGAPISQRAVSTGAINSTGGARTPSPTGGLPAVNGGHEGPITPRNDAGPWVFDGSGIRLRLDGEGGNSGTSSAGRVNSLEAAVNGAGHSGNGSSDEN